MLQEVPLTLLANKYPRLFKALAETNMEDRFGICFNSGPSDPPSIEIPENEVVEGNAFEKYFEIAHTWPPRGI